MLQQLSGEAVSCRAALLLGTAGRAEQQCGTVESNI